MRALRWLFPSPVLSGALFVLWLLLSQSVDAGTVLLGLIVATVFPVITAQLRPTPVRVRHPIVALRLAGRVVRDLLRSNVAVAVAILGRRSDRLASQFVRVPLELRDPNGLAVLAMIICATPGTAWVQVAADRTALLIHVLDAPDEAETIAYIKSAYERPLREIFE